MQDRYYIIWKHLDATQKVEISEFLTKEETIEYFRMITAVPHLRGFIAMLKGIKIIAKEEN